MINLAMGCKAGLSQFELICLTCTAMFIVPGR